MGRFYETEKSRFVDDFIYKPNFQLMANLAGNEQKDYDTNLANAELMKKIDISYIEDPIERARVKAIQDTYGNKIDNLANGLRNSKSMNWRQEFMPGIEGLKRELKTDYDTGDIYKIQKSKDNYDAMMIANKAGIKDIQTREGANNYYMDKWQKNKNRSMDGIFEYKDSFDKKDPIGDFIEEFKKNNDAKNWEKATANPSGTGYLLKSWDGFEVRTEKEIDDSFQRYVDAKGLRPYFSQRQEQLGEKYLDEKGNLDFKDPNSVLSSMTQYGQKVLKVENLKSTKDISVDQNAIDLRERAEKKAAAAAKKKEEMIASMGSSNTHKNFFLNTAEGKQSLANFDKEANKIIPGLDKIKDPAEKQKMINQFKATAPRESLLAFQKAEVLFNADMKAGETELVKVYNENGVAVIRKIANSDEVSKQFFQKPTIIDFGKIPGMTSFSRRDMNKLIGQKDSDAGTDANRLLGVDIYANSGVKILKTPEVKGTGLFGSDAKEAVYEKRKFVIKKIEEVPNTTKTVFINGKLGVTKQMKMISDTGEEHYYQSTLPDAIDMDVVTGEELK